MIPKFTCHVSRTLHDTTGMQQVHLVADDGIERADVFINAPYHNFRPGEAPQEGKEYYVTIVSVDSIERRLRLVAS